MARIEVGGKSVVVPPARVPEPGDYGYHSYMAHLEMHDDFIAEDGYCPLHAEDNDCQYGCGPVLLNEEECEYCNGANR